MCPTNPLASPVLQDTGPIVSVIIVAYRNEQTIIPCLKSLARHIVTSYEVIVVDNSPEHLTSECIEAYRCKSTQHRITLIRPGRNLGFAAGCNLGVSKARGERFLFLNPDTMLENDICSILGRFWDQTAAPGLLGPQIRDGQGRVIRTCRNLPTLWRIFLDATGLDRLVGGYRLLNFDHAQQRRVPQIIGACLYTTREHYEHFHGLDERFFVYFEEVDLCKRMANANYEIWFVPEASIMHLAGTSCESGDVAATMIKQLRLSRSLYFRKHFGRGYSLLLAGLNLAEGLVKGLVFSILYFIKHRPFYREKARGFWGVAKCLGYWR